MEGEVGIEGKEKVKREKERVSKMIYSFYPQDYESLASSYTWECQKEMIRRGTYITVLKYLDCQPWMTMTWLCSIIFIDKDKQLNIWKGWKQLLTRFHEKHEITETKQYSNKVSHIMFVYSNHIVWFLTIWYSFFFYYLFAYFNFLLICLHLEL